MTKILIADRVGGLLLRLWRALTLWRSSAPGVDALPEHMLADIGVTRDAAMRNRLPPELEALRYSG